VKKINVAMLTLGGAALCCLYYAMALFEQYSASGMESPDGVHTVRINNHGSYSYITEAQDQYFVFWLTLGVVLIAIFIAAVAVIKVKK
jgi:hypothetical protein